MNLTEQDIRTTPEVLRQTLVRVGESADTTAMALQGPVIFLGCGTSYLVSQAAAALYEAASGFPAQAIISSEYHRRRGWSHVAISRTGRTTELVEAMRRARDAGLAVTLIEGEPLSPAADQADRVLSLDFAPERGTIQTRFISASLLALRLMIGGGREVALLQTLPDGVERGLAGFDPEPLLAFRHVVFLGMGWRYALAQAAAMNLQETSQLVPEAHQTLEYRHGPIACADTETLVWSFDRPDNDVAATVLRDVARTGATIRQITGDPAVALVQAQLLAVRIAGSRGVDADKPRHLTRAVVY
jgi:glucosamine--fructose-6-phosphate aminotransferase (isomerizing)